MFTLGFRMDCGRSFAERYPDADTPRKNASRFDRDRRCFLLGKRGVFALALRDVLALGWYAHRGGHGVVQACPQVPARAGVSALGFPEGFWEALVGQVLLGCHDRACLQVLYRVPPNGFGRPCCRLVARPCVRVPLSWQGRKRSGHNVDVPRGSFWICFARRGKCLTVKEIGKASRPLPAEGFRASARGARTAQGQSGLWRGAAGDASACG